MNTKKSGDKQTYSTRLVMRNQWISAIKNAQEQEETRFYWTIMLQTTRKKESASWRVFACLGCTLFSDLIENTKGFGGHKQKQINKQTKQSTITTITTIIKTSFFSIMHYRTDPIKNKQTNKKKHNVPKRRVQQHCMLGVFLLPAFTRLGHKCQDLLSPCDGRHVCTD